MRRFSIMLCALAVVGTPVAVLAHHGWSSYDESRPITLTGSLVSVSWANPHGSATMRWQGKPWDVVLAPVSRMEARGLTEAMIAPRQQFSMTGYVRRDGTAEMRVERIMAAGSTVELR